MKITKTDLEAINRNDSDYLLNKGAAFYNTEEYDLAKEYYHLAASLGNNQAIKELNETAEDKYQYPSLYLKLAKLYMPEGKLLTDIETAYIYLNIAKECFITELENGIKYNEKLLEQTNELLKSDIFSKYEID